MEKEMVMDYGLPRTDNKHILDSGKMERFVAMGNIIKKIIQFIKAVSITSLKTVLVFNSFKMVIDLKDNI
jgi:hypothetical protein